MNKFFCNNCQNDVFLENGKCPKCGKDWKNISKNISAKLGEDVSDYNIYNDKVSNDIDEKINNNKKNNTLDNSFNEREMDICKTFDYFFYWGYIIKLLSFVIAIIFTVFSLLDINRSNGLSLIGIVLAVVIVVEGIMMEKRYKWKAYLLETNYEIASKK